MSTDHRSDAWPPVRYEEHTWHSTIPPDVLSRSARTEMARPYRAAIPAAIADIDARLPRSAASAAEQASVVVRDFDAELGNDIAPFATVLLRSEAASSSQIENLTSGARQIALAELGEQARRNATEVVGNVRAMQAAVALSERLDAAAILDMHEALMAATDPQNAGSWRSDQVWIGGGGYSPHRAVFVPPHADRVPAAIDDLIAFLGRADVPALAHAAIAHAQFETIHPFTDGNGRTGRALVHALLRHRRLTRTLTVPVSAGLLTDTRGYFDALTEYRSGEVGPIVTVFAGAAVEAVANGRLLAADLHDLRTEWRSRIQARSDAAVWHLVDLVLRQPVVDTAMVQRELDVSHTNAMKALARLVDIGAIAEVGGRRRSILWQSTSVLSALDAFAARAGRRTVDEP